MTVTQLTINLPNRPGEMAKISEMMGEVGVNILALFVSTATGKGLMRFVADNPEKAAHILASRGLEVSTQEVIAAETPHHAGGLLAVLNPLRRAKINVDYIYPCIQTGESTILIVGAEKQLDEAIDALKKDWIRLFGQELYNM